MYFRNLQLTLRLHGLHSLPDGLRCFKSIHHWHAVVKQDQFIHIRIAEAHQIEPLFDQFERFVPTHGLISRQAKYLDLRLDGHDVEALIVDN